MAEGILIGILASLQTILLIALTYLLLSISRQFKRVFRRFEDIEDLILDEDEEVKNE